MMPINTPMAISINTRRINPVVKSFFFMVKIDIEPRYD